MSEEESNHITDLELTSVLVICDEGDGSSALATSRLRQKSPAQCSICILPPYFRHGTHQRRQIRSWSSGFPAMAGSSKVYVKPCQAMRWSSCLAAHFSELPLAPVDICLRWENRRDARRVSSFQSFQSFQLPYFAILPPCLAIRRFLLRGRVR